MHGIEHILLGYDHLLFVLALILIVANLRMLVTTVTAFTLAHSITLALATLGVVHVPGPPVEAAIALSILLLACELARSSCRPTQPHGAMALAGGVLLRPPARFRFRRRAVGDRLAKGDIPLALFAFNVGVELGQLAFIAAVLTRWPSYDEFRSRRGVAPGEASRDLRDRQLAAFWFVDRVAAFVP